MFTSHKSEDAFITARSQIKATEIRGVNVNEPIFLSGVIRKQHPQKYESEPERKHQLMTIAPISKTIIAIALFLKDAIFTSKDHWPISPLQRNKICHITFIITNLLAKHQRL